LGVLYANGQGVEQDYSQALKWYLLAAESGDAMAQFNVGFMYANAEGAERNYPEAVKWYRLSAMQGQVPAIPVKSEFKPLVGI
jgi:TPR repeat protein